MRHSEAVSAKILRAEAIAIYQSQSTTRGSSTCFDKHLRKKTPNCPATHHHHIQRRKRLSYSWQTAFGHVLIVDADETKLSDRLPINFLSIVARLA
ncbi:hypothetical protein AW878_10740 [Bordetella pseudohinzii]|uniref:Uncharacterized protein n=1 Tax=Bordetella pseudohinzii TaxID=1331258 RepID=A0ABM6DAB8_9BORD|nr:hypothetical protein BBN53_00085 [Bordetella pseudohinzii]KMM26602.1 hypothetical protein L540_11985 [Bordetella pseudohinzii]KXA79211.1 hypothetical protein AW878_10740 [Bordetella pseudohinzii]KXA80961.1 hypothetical protein AW877_05130 [Bordetella pseudohinzii]